MTDYINSLPHELIGMIFSYIDHNELIKHVQNVCRKWKKVVQETGYLWTRFSYGPSYNERPENIAKFLKECPMVQDIWFHYANKGAVGPVIAEYCTKLRKLDFAHGQVVVHYEDLAAILTRNMNLEKLGVYVENNEEARKIAERIGKVEKLKYLKLVGSQGVLFPSRPLAEGCKLLEDVHISTSNFSAEDLIYLLESMKDQIIKLNVKGEFPNGVMAAIGNLQKIKYLRIEESTGIKNRLKTVHQLAKLKTLTYFSLSVGLGGESCSDSKIFESILGCKWPKLDELYLYLYRCDDEPDKLRYLADVYPYLKAIYFDYRSLTQSNIEVLWCGKLLELNALTLLGSWKIDDALFRALRSCQKLNFFRAPEAKYVTDASVDSITALGNLRWLELKECPMSKEGRQCLNQLMPDVYFCITRFCR